MKRSILFTICTLLLWYHASGQVGVISNDPLDIVYYAGWDNNTIIPLTISHKNAQPIVFSTDGQPRAAILPDGRVVIGPTLSSNTLFQIRPNPSNTYPLNYAFEVRNETSGNTTIGAQFQAQVGTQRNIGIHADMDTSAVNTGYYGLYGDCYEGVDCPDSTTKYFAVYGDFKSPDCAGPNAWAGYFVGNVYSTGGFSSSDLNLKTDIEPLVNCSEVLSALHPRRFKYKEEYSEMQLPKGNQFGFLAQELAEVMPHATRSTVYPGQIDDVTDEGRVEFMAVNMNQILPVLIGAFQERQALLVQQTITVAELKERIAQAEARAAVLRHRE